MRMIRSRVLLVVLLPVLAGACSDGGGGKAGGTGGSGGQGGATGGSGGQGGSTGGSTAGSGGQGGAAGAAASGQSVFIGSYTRGWACPPPPDRKSDVEGK